MPPATYKQQSLADLTAEADRRAIELSLAVERTRVLMEEGRRLLDTHRPDLAMGRQMARPAFYAFDERARTEPN